MSKISRKRGSLSKNNKESLPKHLEQINRWAAGIDIGATSHFVAVPEGCDDKPVREFKSFTTDLIALVNWLKQCGIETVAMESTGVYWIPLYELLEENEFDVNLVDARQAKNVSGRKTDVLDCQWIQQLHTYGLLNKAFRPKEDICALRVYVRQRERLVQCAAMHIQHMQKALALMNVKLSQVVSDITGTTGMKIIRAIAAGEYDPKVLSCYRDKRCKNSRETIEKALTGHYRDEHMFALKQALELYDIYQGKLNDCSEMIKKQLSIIGNNSTPAQQSTSSTKPLLKKNSKNAPDFNLRDELQLLTGVDLTEIPGINTLSVLELIAEIGLDMSRWKNSKCFASWLGLCPGNKVSGGKRLSGKTKPSANRAAQVLRMSASSLYRSKSALGAYFRRLKARLGAPKATTATAHKLATIIYNMLLNGTCYAELGAEYYEKQYRQRVIKNLKNRAKALGLDLIKVAKNTTEENQENQQVT